MNVSKSSLKPRGLRKPVESDLGFRWGIWNSLLLVLGVVILVAGYVSLSRGSITLAPVLLVLGYIALIPASLVIGRQSPGSGE